MAGSFPFRRDTQIDPYKFLITGPNDTPVGTVVNKIQLADRNVETFRVSNPAKCWIWLRGWQSGTPDFTTYADIAEKGHLFGPGVIEIMKTQYPDKIYVVAANFPDWPVLNGATYLYPNRYAYIHYGGGF